MIETLREAHAVGMVEPRFGLSSVLDTLSHVRTKVYGHRLDAGAFRAVIHGFDTIHVFHRPRARFALTRVFTTKECI